MSRLVSLRRRWYYLLRAVPLLLVVALLPSLTYLDHWVDHANHAQSVPLRGTAEEEHAVHYSHCHFGPATCSDQPVPPNLRSFEALVELPVPDLPAVLQEETVSVPEEFIVSLLTEPPRHAARVS